MRRLERAASTGDPSARAELLTARMRAGSLTRERMELAAYCGDPVARAVLPRRAAGNCNGPCTLCNDQGVAITVVDVPGGWACLYHLDHANLSLAEWIGHYQQPRSGLARWGQAARRPEDSHVLVRASVAAAQDGVAHWLPCPGEVDSWHATPRGDCRCGYGYDAHRNPDKNPRLARTVEAVEVAAAWLRNRDTSALSRLPADAHRINIRAPGYYVAEALWQIQCGSVNAHQLLGFEVENCVRLAGEARVRDAVRRALTAWALS